MDATALLKPAQFLEWMGFLLVAIGSIGQAGGVVVNKKLILKGLPPDIATATTTLASGLMLLAASYLYAPARIWSVFDWQIGIFWPLASTCILNIVVIYGNTRALALADVSLTQPIQALQPLVSMLPSWWILGEVPSNTGYVGILLIGIGLYIYSLSIDIKKPEKFPDWAKKPDGTLRWSAPIVALFEVNGVRIMFLVAVFGAVAVNFDKKAVILSSYLFFPGVVNIFLGVFGIIAGLISINKRQEWKKLRKEHIGLLLLRTLMNVATQSLYCKAFRYGMAIYVSAMKRLHILFLIPLAHWFLNEDTARNKKFIIGFGIFIAGILLFAKWN